MESVTVAARYTRLKWPSTWVEWGSKMQILFVEAAFTNRNADQKDERLEQQDNKVAETEEDEEEEENVGIDEAARRNRSA